MMYSGSGAAVARVAPGMAGTHGGRNRSPWVYQANHQLFPYLIAGYTFRSGYFLIPRPSTSDS